MSQRPQPSKPRENSLEYEFQQAWRRIRKIKDERLYTNPR